MAPEMHKGQHYVGWAADVWSLGVLLYIMLIGSIPFVASDISKLPQVVMKGELDFPAKVKLSNEAKDLI
jgi:serine/threonine protein kinase